MKLFLFACWSFFLLNGNVLALQTPFAGSQKEAVQQTPAPKPIKVSELNANLFSAIYDFFQETSVFLFEGFVSLKDFVETGKWIVENLQNPEMQEIFGSFTLRLLTSLLVAFAIAQGLTIWIRPKIHELLRCKEQLFPHKQRMLVKAALLSVVSPLVFGFFFYTIFRLLNPLNEFYLEGMRILSSGIVTIWILLNLAYIFLKPPTPEHQHIPLSQEILATTYAWLWRMSIVALFGFFFLETGALIHLPLAGEKLLLQGSGLIISIMAIFMMLALHEEVKEWIQKQRSTQKLSALKKSMLSYLQYSYIPAIIFIVISYVSWVTQEFSSLQITIWKLLLTISLLPFLRYASHCLRKLRILYIQKNLKSWSLSFSKRALFYGRQIDFVMSMLLNVVAALFILDLWGLNPSYFIFSNIGRLIAEKAFSIFTIIVVALFITRMGNGLLNKYLMLEISLLNASQKQKIARFKTIYSVSRNVLRVAVWTPALLLIIMELEVEIMPILATVSIVSFGLTFGVQHLIKDLVTGFFMLLEDAFAVGDLVVINEHVGRIESLTVRVVRLRTTDGSLYTFPYGNITSLCNQNRDFSAAVMIFQVGLEADVDQIFEILKKISKDLQKDPITSPLVVDDIEIDGVNAVNDHALEIRAVLKTRPSEHYKIKWAFNRLLKQYLVSYDIPPATPRQVAYNYNKTSRRSQIFP